MSLGDSGAEHLPCVAITCPRCLDRLRALRVEGDVEAWRGYCRTCARRIALTLEPGPPDNLECRHSLAGGVRCKDVVRCLSEFPLHRP